jgi:FKBP-type peptidyl-prolyl cis-trans isomerase
MCFYIKTDSLYGSFMPSFAQKKKYMKFYITLLDFMSKEKWKEKLTKDFNLQATIDDRILQEYFAQKNKRPNAIGKGLYYLIANKGNTKFPVAGDTIRVNYTGKLTSGKVFDSNTDPQFKHVESFEFVVGKGNVIKGWDEGLLYFDEHSKGTLYIPSGLAYGKRASGIIPVNGILIFDIELLAIHPAK